MATPFSSIYAKFLADIDDYELGMVSDDELNNICFGYLEKARAIYFPQCKQDLEDVTIQLQSEIDALEPVPPVKDTGDNADVEDAVIDSEGGTPSTQSLEDEETAEDTDIVEDTVADEDEEVYKVDKIIGQFNVDLTNREQYILALGMKKAWLSSKRYSADLMSKDIGDRDYKAVQGYNYLKEIGNLDNELEEEIRRYAVEYTYSVDALGEGW